jgi:hypothetical protein
MEYEEASEEHKHVHRQIKETRVVANYPNNLQHPHNSYNLF